MGPEWCHGTHRWSHTHKYKYWIIYMEPQVMFMNRNNGDKQSRDTMDCDTARVSWWSELLLWYFSFRWPTATTNIHCGKYSSQQTDQQNTNIIQITFTSDSVMIFSISRRMMKMRRWFQEAWQRSGLSSVPARGVHYDYQTCIWALRNYDSGVYDMEISINMIGPYCDLTIKYI